MPQTHDMTPDEYLEATLESLLATPLKFSDELHSRISTALSPGLRAHLQPEEIAA